MVKLSTTHTKTLEKVFKKPTLSSIEWDRVESMLLAIGAVVENGAGSRVHITLNDEGATFHRPHPHKEMDKGAVKSLQTFLKRAGFKPGK